MDVDQLLSLTVDDLEKMSNAELKELAIKAQDQGDEFYTYQIAYKTLINSLYGALGNKAFILFNEKIAEAITGNGRFFIKSLGNAVDAHLKDLFKSNEDFWVYADTDSIYYSVKPLVERFKEKHPEASLTDVVNVCHGFENRVIGPIIQDVITDFTTRLNALDVSACNAKMEVIADKVIFIAKKRYLARIRESESSVYPENQPKIKAMGVELIKSSTSVFAQNCLNDAIDILLDGDNAQLFDWITEIKDKFYQAKISDIATTSSVSRLDYDFASDKVPYNSRAALYYNEYLKEHSLENRYTPIFPGDKMKIVTMLAPNPFAKVMRSSSGNLIQPNVMAFLEDDFGENLRKYVDYDAQFEKSVISPLKFMTDAIGFKVVKTAPSLLDMF